ncbi:hypothetical protein COY25_00140 [Candidatus Uhrbacteria bacterium CG_4_10_14_0_2_um_filter_41_7]|uniref:Uncharacterized protein n=1 Tax=Candidatus Uhrbacteria bacterium CG_4_9_14_3_um_filter_41_35 TaxID=1975034 RepID=A0A2M7XGW6_9BACT|nr:MAG: hypothetical protein COV92_02750 [Candidatus Uhrbacteria bacterium CG11_big_fil_rev_8_21_14_0_20_41_9]PIZ55848.1 MAG: hypothetical protein COY25_00140 [Candidatus Uhrbacteria bacterium CG_4_10_14_0_2_um_filter_41_7]PJA47114.1 MAG: hypothetical protein CO173_00010 [Candidatus Uhrbacteria bacterium CG_4_9_14_3_um_filter_41_35]
METLKNNPEHETVNKSIEEFKRRIDDQLKSIGKIAKEVAEASAEDRQLAIDELNRASLTLQHLREELYELNPHRNAA